MTIEEAIDILRKFTRKADEEAIRRVNAEIEKLSGEFQRQCVEQALKDPKFRAFLPSLGLRILAGDKLTEIERMFMTQFAVAKIHEILTLISDAEDGSKLTNLLGQEVRCSYPGIDKVFQGVFVDYIPGGELISDALVKRYYEVHDEDPEAEKKLNRWSRTENARIILQKSNGFHVIPVGPKGIMIDPA